MNKFANALATVQPDGHGMHLPSRIILYTFYYTLVLIKKGNLPFLLPQFQKSECLPKRNGKYT